MAIIALAIISCGSESNSGDSDYFEEESPVPVRLDTFLDTDNDGLVNAYDSDYLNAEVKINGNGTLDNPYRIRTIYQLQAIAGVDHNGNILNQSQFTNRSWLFGDSKEEQLRSVYTLPVINLDASFTREWNNGSGFHPIGRCENTLSCADSTQVFTGRFIGAGHRITNLYISRQREDQIGLFGTIGTEGQVSLLSLDNVYILGGNIVGGMAARNYGNITASSTEGNFISGNFSGGLVGINYGRISAASFEGEINSGSYIGGIVGENLGQIEYSYAEGIIIGKTLVGGLVGSNSGTVYDSHTYIGVGLGPGGLGGGLIGLGEGINLNETLCRDIFSGWDKELVQNNTSVFWDFSDRESPPVLVSRSLDNKADIRINQCLITAKESCRTNILLSQASEGVKLIRLVTPPGDSVVNYEPAFKIEDTELFRVDGENLVLARNAIAKDIGVHKFRVQVMLAAGDGKVYDYSQEIVAQFIDK